MADSNDSRPTPIGTYVRPAKGGATGIEIAAAALSVGWLMLSGAFFVLYGGDGADGLRFVLTMMVVFMPVAMIWVAATSARASRVMREESARLHTAIDAIRNAYLAQAQAGRGDRTNGSIARKLDEIVATQRKTEAAMAMITAQRAVDSAAPAAPTAPAAAQPEDQPTLSLGTPADALQPPLSNADFIRALNFPETAEDAAGFAALRRALKDRPAAQLIQAAQDVLTLLSQDGIYMDDLRPDMARTEIWRAFASGARGREIAALGGVRDRSSLALTAGRMKQDPIFRDAAHHFLRLFDRAVARFAPEASDSELSDLANTRSSRAFMLLGRVAGTFD
ncbi:hypothetical protein AL036_06545 [Salipiger aestuarii]|uniref:Uncharacterized protein n=1 Tax=Salipiger aestuarii TaxID=568098 RepID=A0A327YDZ9_9RHOB|nr:hypothetical protein [Salipiger aestuarii]EIE50368.1 hypothetical protein C357_14207 [Citreicella sp. 357]KAA8608541.1 hypothetical protein AL036_06545 [Salipiger aestuarii]KAA8614212.1 hypothetical protein AL037_04500 [Salipiger aestuarii]KAB2542385.1 hypothetical protein AL035_07675 [Salipiger aestuarii]RAK18286.1 hypothetical protein ATI53_10135 [Salipiger aestuarii]